jgi:hypothetical protein
MARESLDWRDMIFVRLDVENSFHSRSRELEPVLDGSGRSFGSGDRTKIVPMENLAISRALLAGRTQDETGPFDRDDSDQVTTGRGLTPVTNS